MKTYLAAAAFAAAFAQPATAITFPALTTIYVAAGIFDDGGAAQNGTATVISCANVSGLSAQIRFLVLDEAGAVTGNQIVTVTHGRPVIAATHLTSAYFSETNLSTGALQDTAVLNIESTQSGVFCTGVVVNAAGFAHEGAPLHLVRVNAHPGTVE